MCPVPCINNNFIDTTLHQGWQVVDKAEFCGIIDMRPAFAVNTDREYMSGCIPDTIKRRDVLRRPEDGYRQDIAGGIQFSETIASTGPWTITENKVATSENPGCVDYLPYLITGSSVDNVSESNQEARLRTAA